MQPIYALQFIYQKAYYVLVLFKTAYLSGENGGIFAHILQYINIIVQIFVLNDYF